MTYLHRFTYILTYISTCKHAYIHTSPYVDPALQFFIQFLHSMEILILVYITLQNITFKYIALHCITLHYIAFHHIIYCTLHYISLHYTISHYIILHTLNGFRNIRLRFITFYCMILYVKFHYIVLLFLC